jgi:hypothetical protein
MIKNKVTKKIGTHYTNKQKNTAIKKLLKAFSIDATVTQACSSAGISRDTYYNWIKDDPLLSDRIERAQDKFILSLKEVITRESLINPNMALKVLSKREPTRYGNFPEPERMSFNYTLVVTDKVQVKQSEPAKIR